VLEAPDALDTPGAGAYRLGRVLGFGSAATVREATDAAGRQVLGGVDPATRAERTPGRGEDREQALRDQLPRVPAPAQRDRAHGARGLGPRLQAAGDGAHARGRAFDVSLRSERRTPRRASRNGFPGARASRGRFPDARRTPRRAPRGGPEAARESLVRNRPRSSSAGPSASISCSSTGAGTSSRTCRSTTWSPATSRSTPRPRGPSSPSWRPASRRWWRTGSCTTTSRPRTCWWRSGPTARCTCGSRTSAWPSSTLAVRKL